MTIDGVPNAVDEVEVQRVPVGPDNPYGNAIGRKYHPASTRNPPPPALRTTPSAALGGSSNPTSVNRLGEPVSYVLYPQGQPPLLADPSSSVARRAAFATKHLWVNPVRSRPTVPGRRTGQPTPRRRRLAANGRSRTGTSTARTSWCGTSSASPTSHARGLADHAGRHVRLHPETVRFLRPQPHPGRTILRPALALMPAAPFTSDELARVLLPFGESCMLPARPNTDPDGWLGSGGICSRWLCCVGRLDELFAGGVTQLGGWWGRAGVVHSGWGFGWGVCQYLSASGA